MDVQSEIIFYSLTRASLQNLISDHISDNIPNENFDYSYGKCSKIPKTFHFLFSNKMLLFKAGIHKMLVSSKQRRP